METRLKRFDDWPARLHALIEVRQAETFTWGGNDCCLFAANAVLAMTGLDPAATLRGTYSTELEAKEIIANHGTFSGLCHHLARLNGMPPIRLPQAWRGDIAWVTFGQDQEALGILMGNGVACSAPRGVIMLPRSSVQTVWSV